VRRTEKRKPELITGRKAQPRKDAVIGASATRVHPWWRGAIDSRRRASRVIRPSSHDAAHARYSNGHGKKNIGLDPKSAVGVPGRWFPTGRLTQRRHRLRTVALANVCHGWEDGGELGCGGVNPGYRYGRVCWKRPRGQVFRLWIAVESSFWRS
jgi:hypothetical protein